MNDFDVFLEQEQARLKANGGLDWERVLAEANVLIAAGQRPDEARLAQFFKALRGRRMFNHITDLAARIPGLTHPPAINLWSQAEIDQGRLDQALARLASVRSISRAYGMRAYSETVGLVGRAQKDSFVKAMERGDHGQAKAALRDAMNAYAEGYPINIPWHGANMAALAWRAEHEGFGLPQSPDAVGRRLINDLGDDASHLSAWDIAALAQAHMARGNWTRGAELYGLYTHKLCDGAGSQAIFQVFGDLRQLSEIWLAHTPDAPGYAAFATVTRAVAELAGQDPPQDGMAAEGSATAQAAATAAVAPDDATADRQATLEQAYQTAVTVSRQASGNAAGGLGAIPVEVLLQAVIAPGFNASPDLIETLFGQQRNICRVRRAIGQNGGGTGFLVNPTTLNLAAGPPVVVTNEHVLTDEVQLDKQIHPDDAEIFFERWEGKSFKPGEILWRSPWNGAHDITVVTVPGIEEHQPKSVSLLRRATSFPPARDTRRVLGHVIPIGHPQGGPMVWPFGGNEVIDQNMDLASAQVRLVHYTANTQPGMSGSPVFDSTGAVVAVHRRHAKAPIDPSRVTDHPADYEANEGVGIDSVRRACGTDHSAGRTVHKPG